MDGPLSRIFKRKYFVKLAIGRFHAIIWVQTDCLCESLSLGTIHFVRSDGVERNRHSVTLQLVPFSYETERVPFEKRWNGTE